MTQLIEGQVTSDKVLDVLDQILGMGGDLEPEMRSIARFMENEVILGFKQSRSPYGESWAPISHRSGQPLIDTRDLLGSISSNYGPDFAEVGTNKEYGPIHQFGGYTGINKSAKITARPYLPIEGEEVVLPEYWEEEVLAILTSKLERLTNG